MSEYLGNEIKHGGYKQLINVVVIASSSRRP